MQAEQIEIMDCTNRSQREGKSFEFNNNMVILGSPVYYGRIPEEVVPFLNTLSFTPETDADKFTQCSLCAEVCPANAIDLDDVSKINKWQCMICFACVKNCPSDAKQMTDPHFNGAIQQLQMACQERKEPEMYL